jgi:hypothetical protein
VSVGWVGHRRVHGCVLHLDIINEKIWVQHNTTELQIGQELVAIGIHKEDIIVWFCIVKYSQTWFSIIDNCHFFTKPCRRIEI